MVAWPGAAGRPAPLPASPGARYSPAMNTTASTRIAAAIHRRYGETVDVPEDLPGARRPGRHERALGLPALSRRPGPGGAAAAPLRDGARVADQERPPAGERDPGRAGPGPGGDRRAPPRLAVDRRRAGVPGLLRRRLPPAARVRAARARVPERAPRRVLQRHGRRRDRALDVRPGGGARRPRQLPHQRDPQPRGRRRRAARPARLGLPDRRPDARAGPRRTSP